MPFSLILFIFFIFLLAQTFPPWCSLPPTNFSINLRQLQRFIFAEEFFVWIPTVASQHHFLSSQILAPTSRIGKFLLCHFQHSFPSLRIFLYHLIHILFGSPASLTQLSPFNHCYVYFVGDNSWLYNNLHYVIQIDIKYLMQLEDYARISLTFYCPFTQYKPRKHLFAWSLDLF